jgi:putative pyrroloquinoline-quinone binding quinoprotein/putative pyrroloquinoline-quinone-binding quinoprotein
MAMGISITIAASGVRNEKTLFRDQPLEWDPQFRSEHKAAPITLTRSWVFAGFKAPLAGDPVVSGDRLIAAGVDGSLIALDPSQGVAIWSTRLPDDLDIGPAVLEGSVFLATKKGLLFAVDAGEGEVLWSVDLGSPAAFPPRPSGGRLLVVTSAAGLIALDPKNGRLIARRPLPGRPTTPPEPAHGFLLIGTDHGMLLALDETSLETRWSRYLRHPITAPAFVRGRRIYVAVGDRSLRCLRLRSGRPVWTFRTGAIVTARPFSVGPWLYFLCYDDDIYVLRARSGHLMTRVRMGHRLDVDPARTDDHLFVAPFKEAAIVGLTLPDLQSAGRYQLDIPGESFTTAPVIVSGGVAIGYGWTEGRVLALRVDRQEPDGKKPANGEPATPPAAGHLPGPPAGEAPSAGGSASGRGPRP